MQRLKGKKHHFKVKALEKERPETRQNGGLGVSFGLTLPALSSQ